MTTMTDGAGLKQFTTKGGTVYAISECGQFAWPLVGDVNTFTGEYTCEDAEYRGHMVDRDIPSNDYRVRGAGPAWAEVYAYLRSR